MFAHVFSLFNSWLPGDRRVPSQAPRQIPLPCPLSTQNVCRYCRIVKRTHKTSKGILSRQEKFNWLYRKICIYPHSGPFGCGIFHIFRQNRKFKNFSLDNPGAVMLSSGCHIHQSCGLKSPLRGAHIKCECRTRTTVGVASGIFTLRVTFND